MVRTLLVISILSISACVIVEPPEPAPDPVVRIDFSASSSIIENAEIEADGMKFSPSFQEDWLIFSTENVTLNLKELASQPLTVFEETIASDSLFRVKLEIGASNFIQVEGVKYPLNLDQITEEARVVVIEEELTKGDTLNVHLEIDVEKSIIKDPSSDIFYLTPVIYKK